MRIGASVLLENEECIQSYNWSLKRPHGNLSNIINFLDSYEVDEITIIRPVRRNNNIIKFQKDIDLIKHLKCNSPLCFGGGIRHIKTLKLLSNLPFERVNFSSSFINLDYRLIEKAIEIFGSQAIIAVLPITIKNETLFVYDSQKAKHIMLTNEIIKFVQVYADEILIIDTLNEGMTGKFNFDILDRLKSISKKFIISGGIDKNIINKAKKYSSISCCLIDNRTLHKENYIKTELS